MVVGDTSSMHLRISNQGELVPFESGDTVYLSVKRRLRDEEYLLHKAITKFEEDGSVIIPIEPEDTKHLPVGTYKYDIQVTFANKTVKTVIEVSDFVLRPGVTDE